MKTNDYNYKHFGLKEYDFERFEGPRVGQIAPDFEAFTIEGKKVKLSDFRKKIVVFESGSSTCPLTVGIINTMQKLMRKYPHVIFLLLYVREAHPGERTPAHRTFEEKLSCARRFKEEEHDNRLILVDNLEGTIHKQYGLYPTFVYVIDPEGYVAFRMPWNVPERLDEVLEAMSEGKVARFPESYEPPKYPHGGFRALRRAGWQALWDVLLNIPRGLWTRYKFRRLKK